MKRTSNDFKQNKSQLGLSAKRSPSQESTASVSNPSSGRFTGRANADNTQDGGSAIQYGQYLFDIVAAVVWCPKHKKFCLSRISGSKGLWLPFARLRAGDGWYDSIVARLRQILAVAPGGTGNKSYLAFKPPDLLHILRIQVPTYFDFITRVIFVTELTHDPKYPSNCCENNKIINWFAHSEFSLGRIRDLWGPEPTVFVDAIMGNQLEKGTYTEYTVREALKFAPREPPKTYQEELLKASGFQEKDILKMYSEFIQHCYPSQYMTNYSFNDYMNKVGLTNIASEDSSTQITSYFRAFGSSRAPYLSFHEMLMGLAAVDKNTTHGGHVAELRTGYIFRFYNQSEPNAYLEYEDIKNLTRDVLKLKSPQVDDSKLESELKNNYNIFGVKYKERVDEKLFLRSVGGMQFRGTSGLFRSNVSPLQQIRLKRAYNSIQLIQTQSTGSGVEAKLQRAKGTCLRCRDKRYTLSAHSVRLSSDGNIVDPQDNKNQSDVTRMPKTLRRMSDLSFTASTTANVILDNLRAFADSGAVSGLNARQITKTDNSQASLWANRNSRSQLVDKVLKLCTEAETLIKKEPRVVKVNSPCFVLGDIHGNFHDLMLYDRMLWKMGPTCVSANYLFLGDYVDRGEHGLECILYLLSNKLLAPEKFWLLRGNHELRPVQQQFTFHKECSDKFGPKYGPQIWEELNKVFDLLPICGIIDDSIFCAHGGIPTSATKIEELLKIPTPLSEPENQSAPAWEMLWNDPVSNQEFDDYSQMLRAQSGSSALNNLPGFLPNTKRGTAYYFSEEAVNKFLSTNGLSHVIRGHEVIPAGYQFHMGGKVITVFSSSKYCGGLNESACVLVDREKIRIIKIDTT